MKREKILCAVILASFGAVAHGQVMVSSHSYYAYCNLANTNGGIYTGNFDSGSLIGGGTVSTSISGTRSDTGAVTQHFGESTGTFATNSNGMSGNMSAHSKTTFLGGFSQFIGQITDSGFNQTVDFTVGTTQQYRADMNGFITIFHRSYLPFGPAGSFFYTLRLYGTDTGLYFDSGVQNSLTLSNVPFTQTVTLHQGATYRLEYFGACNGTTVYYETPEAGPGAYGETAFNGSYSLQAVPEPTSLSACVLGIFAFARRRRNLAS